ncbi:MAG: bifunctional nicotinamide-nucleotide adenylyltransferase/Nudix hydroxylase [Alphaproteobacteria bacterium]
MTERFDELVFFGRFCPFHKGHLRVIEKGLEQADRVLVLVGSVDQPRDIRTPFSFEERAQMIRASLSAADRDRVVIRSMADWVYNDQSWIRQVQELVAAEVAPKPLSEAKVALIGAARGGSNYFRKFFPQWGAVQVQPLADVEATPLRMSYLLDDFAEWSKRYGAQLPEPVFTLLQAFAGSEAHQALSDEARFIAEYRKGWADAPHAPIFVTVNAVVIQSGHVLMLKRRALPGKGLLALPGGFIGERERLKPAMLRVLREEARIKVPAPVLEGSIFMNRVFDDPWRSARGRTIAHVFGLELKPDPEGLPKLRNSDAAWIPLAELKPLTIFEDHWHIINAALGEI